MPTHYLFVYCAYGKPSLTLLPPFTKRLLPELESVGILCNDEHLAASTPGYHHRNTRTEKVVGPQLFVLHSSEWKSQICRLPVRFDNKEDMNKFHTWSMDRVVSFRTYLCWIDLRFGALFYNVLEEPHLVTYVGLHVDDCVLMCAKTCMDMYTRICVVEREGGPLM